ncbi:hypothetical protein L1887_46858 [Cichorium endivia]|nr:hypothetical protein L1887_46858 [Cichorium endivia]
MSNDKSCEKHDRLPVEGTPERAAVRWVHESDEVALTTEPCLSVGANWMIGPRAAPSSPHSPFPNMNLESSKPF